MNLKQKTDLMWKCLAVAIFSTCTITACSNDGNEMCAADWLLGLFYEAIETQLGMIDQALL